MIRYLAIARLWLIDWVDSSRMSRRLLTGRDEETVLAAELSLRRKCGIVAESTCILLSGERHWMSLKYSVW